MTIVELRRREARFYHRGRRFKLTLVRFGPPELLVYEAKAGWTFRFYEPVHPQTTRLGLATINRLLPRLDDLLNEEELIARL